MDMMTESAPRFQIDLQAEDYLTVLARMHAMLQPETYLEIGSRSGDSLKLATCASLAIDPMFGIADNVLGSKPSLQLYQITSDRFFARHSAAQLLGGAVEMAFLDGMHLSEFLLRDFMNVEHACKPNSVIAMHDCMPSDALMTCRNEGDDMRLRSLFPGWWTGDVWKMVWALKTFRPDLTIIAIDAPPTGLVCVTNLDPSSRVLEDGYARIIAAMAALGDSEETLQAYLASLQPIKPSRLSTYDKMSEFFYL